MERLDALVDYPRELATNPDTQDTVLNLTAILRWEFFPGSTLSLIYTRLQNPPARLGLLDAATLDLGALRRGPAQDVFRIKLSYLWG